MDSMGRYSMVIQWSDEDSKYIVSFPEFGDHAHTAGKNYEEAVKNGQEALALLVETFQQQGQSLPQPRTYAAVGQ